MLKRVVIFLGATLLLSGCFDMQDTSYITGQKVENNDFIAQGNEPFWTITTDQVENHLLLHTPSQLDGVRFPMRAERLVDGWRFATKGAESMVLTITKNECMDDMSGWVFTYTAAYEDKSGVHQGCANPLGMEPDKSQSEEGI